jgi:hypothetical protein
MPVLDRREEARVHYPHPNKSAFLIEDWALDVIDLSETGLRFRSANYVRDDAVGSPFVGIVCFRHGETAPVAGTLIRVTGSDVAVRMEEIPVPPEVLWAERRYLATRRRGMIW